MNIDEIDPVTQARAVALHARLAEIDMTEVPVMTLNRNIARKEQAVLARELFKRLGLKGISVTTPNYSMAQTVEVTPPKRRDYELDRSGIMVGGCPAAVANQQARERLLAILLAAFPHHDDRSDTQTDYFDYCWSVA